MEKQKQDHQTIFFSDCLNNAKVNTRRFYLQNNNFM